MRRSRCRAFFPPPRRARSLRASRRGLIFSTMPIYEFYSPDTRKIYTFFARSLAHAGKTPRCPDNPKARMEKLISNFSVTGRAKEKDEFSAGGEGDDAQMDATMAEMEREFR